MDKTKLRDLLFLVSKEKQARVKRLFYIQDAQRTLIAEILVRSILCNKMKLNNRNIAFGNNKYGKPHVRDIEDFHFNVSHSGKWVVCAVDNAPIGIDIEMIKTISLDIANRFFSKEEYMVIIKKDEQSRLDYFYSLWTLKESYVKAIGKGLSIPFNIFTIKQGISGIELETQNNQFPPLFKQYFLGEKYKLSVCAFNNRFPDNIIFNKVEKCVDILRRERNLQEDLEDGGNVYNTEDVF